MDKEITLKTLIEGGRESKNISQRELARRIGLSNTSLNDLEKGKVKKRHFFNKNLFCRKFCLLIDVAFSN